MGDNILYRKATVLNLSNQELTEQQLGLLKEYVGREIIVLHPSENIRKAFKNLPQSQGDRRELAEKILDFVSKIEPDIIHVDGEAHFVFLLVTELKNKGYRCVKFYSRSEIIEEIDFNKSVKKTIYFHPVGILEY